MSLPPEAMAALHRQCFDTPPPWSAASFAATLQSPGVFLLTRPQGFLLGRVIANEAELLTLAVDPATRRQGTGRALTDDFARQAAAQGAAEAFLEVASDNHAAQALYAAACWQVVGQRRGYYAPGVDAVVMRLRLARPVNGPGDSII